MGCVGAEFVPVIAVVANEVGDLTEGLVCDSVLDGHGLVWRGGWCVCLINNEQSGWGCGVCVAGGRFWIWVRWT